MSRLVLLSLTVPIAASAAHASDSSTYTYDALGRLTATATTGGVNSGLSVTYAHDPADNRTNTTTTGATGVGKPDVGVVVVPLNGFTFIPFLTVP